MRLCSSCKQHLTEEQFHEIHKAKTQPSGWCKACHQKKTLMRKYNISGERYDALIAIKACEACGSDNDGKALHIDHDHTTGVVRGVLCRPCNHAIGLLLDDPARLRAAANYIETHQGATA
jgi:hypothetical protein